MKCKSCGKLFDESNSKNIRVTVVQSGITSHILRCPHCKATNSSNEKEDREIIKVVFPEIVDTPSGNRGEMFTD